MKEFSASEDQSLFEGKWQFEKNIKSASKNSDAIVVLTEWKEYAEIDWRLISKSMRSPGWVFDARSILMPSKVLDSGLNLWRIGNGA